jgi:hypothetical protein
MGNSSLKLVYLKRESFAFTTNFEIDCDIINDNLKRYKKILFPPNFIINVPDNENILIELRINIESNKMCPEYPGTNEDESCIFNISY